jgi:O-methyltransferase
MNIYKKLKDRVYYKLYYTFYREIARDNHILSKKDITYSNDLLYTYHNADFIKDAKFAEAYKMVKETGGDLLSNYDIQWRVHVICWFANTVKYLEGDFVDCGVNTGFCPRAVINYTGFNALDKTYHLFDTFAGMDPKYSSDYEMDRHDKLGYGKNDGLYQEVKERFKEDKVNIIKGSVPETLAGASIDRVAYLSIDMNCVYPEVMALEFFWDKLVKGAVIVLDDYGYPGCIEQKQAHDRFATSKGVEVLSLPTCQGIIIKPW